MAKEPVIIVVAAYGGHQHWDITCAFEHDGLTTDFNVHNALLGANLDHDEDGRKIVLAAAEALVEALKAWQPAQDVCRRAQARAR